MSIFNKSLNIIILISVLFFASNGISVSQNLSEGEQEVKTKAAELFKTKKYNEAIPYYSQLLSLYPKDPDYNYKYGICLVISNKEVKTAINHLSLIVNKEVPANAAFYLGEAYHLTYKFDEAIKYYNQYKAKGSKTEMKELQVDRKIDMCNNGKDLIRYISDLIVLENKQIDKKDFYRSYEIKDFGGDILVMPDEFKSKVDKTENEQTLMFLSKALNSVYYASYGANKDNGKDIYKRDKYPDGTWSEPQNLGSTINTPQDENFPFIHPDGVTLYFSSKGHNSMGGYDIYKTVYDKNKSEWSKPQNLDFPTNSPYDDILFTTDAQEEIAFFASRRETAGDLISVYKIQVDKSPIEKESFDIEEVIQKAKLEITPLADNLKATNATSVGGKNNLALKTEKINFDSYTFSKLTPTATTPKEEIIAESKKDAEIIKLEAKSVKVDANYSYVIADEKNKEAEAKLKEAENIKSAIAFITDETKKNNALAKAENLENEAETLTNESIVAYNIAKNLDKVAEEKEKEATKIEEFTTGLENNPNQNVMYLADQVNKNRETLNQTQDKFTTFDTEVKARQQNLDSESRVLEQKLVAVQQISKQANDVKNDLEKAKISLNNPENELNKATIQKHVTDLENQYNNIKIEEEKSVAETQKVRVNIDNLNKEVAFLQTISTDLTNETKKAEVAQKVTEVNKEDLNKQIAEKEFVAESNTGKIAENQPKKEVDDVIFESTNTLATATENANNSENLKKQAETNNQVVDSLNLMLEKKNEELATIEDPAKKEDLKKEIQEIEFIAEIKTQQAEKNLIEAKANEPEKVEPVYVATETGNKQEDYKTELTKAQQLETINNNLESNLNIMKQNLDTVSNTETKEAIKKSIIEIENKIDENTLMAENSFTTAQKIKAENPTEIVDANVSTEELLKKAVEYKSENPIPLDVKQANQLETAPQDKEYAQRLYSNYEDLNKKAEAVIAQANSATKESDKSKLLKEAQEIQAKADNEFHLFNETYALVNNEEFGVYDEVIENNVVVANNKDLDVAHSLTNEAEIYFNKAKTIRKNADLFEDNKRKTEELVKAKDLELIAIAKQKQAIDIYVKAKSEGVTAENPKTETQQEAPKNEITLLYEEEENLKKFREKEYMAEALLTANNQNLEKLQKEKNDAALILNPKKKEVALAEIKKKEDAYNVKLVEAYSLHGKADSLKYGVYQNQIAQLTSNLEDKSTKKILAKQYTNEADFYYQEAQKLRQDGTAKPNVTEKIADLRKATELEKKALTSQETAVNAITDNNSVIFATSNDLVKIDILENLNKPVNTANIEAVEETEMLSVLNLKRDDISAVENANQKQDETDIKMKEANALLRQAEDMKKLAATLTSNSAKNKSLKEADKLKEKAQNLQFNAAESYELVNNTKFSIFEDYLKKVRLNDNSNESRQGKLLEKQANQHFYKAKDLRDMYYMAAGTKKADYALLEKAYNLETEALQEIKKAYRIYLKMPTADSLDAKDSLALVSNISTDLLIKKAADITPLGFANSDSLLAEKAKQDQIIAEAKAKENHLKTEELKTIEPEKVVAEEQNKVIEENVTKLEKSVEPEKKIAENIVVENKPDKKVEVKPEPEKQEVKPVVEKAKPQPDKLLTTTAFVNENGEPLFGFSILGNTPYSDKNPIPINPKLPDCIVFKVQIGAFVNPIKQETFNGLFPITGEKLQNSNYTRFFVGQFRSIEATRVVLNEVKKLGYNDAFIVAYIDGNKVTPIQAENMIKAGKDACVAGYDQVVQNELNMVKNLTTTGADYAKNVVAGVGANKNIADAVGRNLVQAQELTSVKGVLYTVQIGVYKQAPTSDQLKNLSPLYQETTPTGFIRFTTGVFDKYETARTEKNNIVQLGIPDAFVTAYRDGQKIGLDEAKNIENTNAAQFAKTTGVNAPQAETPKANANANGDASQIIFKVQIGAYEKAVPNEVVTTLLKAATMKDFEQKVQNGLTVYSVGKFKNYEEAVQAKNILVNEQVAGAFVVAYNGETKISVEEAKKLLNQ